MTRTRLAVVSFASASAVFVALTGIAPQLPPSNVDENAPSDTIQLFLDGRTVSTAKPQWTWIAPTTDPWYEPLFRSIHFDGSEVFAADERENEIQILEASRGTSKGRIRAFGQSPGRFWSPQAAIRWKGRLWVADAGNSRLIALGPGSSSTAVDVSGEPRAFAVAGDSMIFATHDAVGWRLWLLRRADTIARPVERIPLYRTVRSLGIADDGTVAVVSSPSTLDVFPRAGESFTVRFRALNEERNRDGAKHLALAGSLLRVAPVHGNSGLWWMVIGPFVACVDLRTPTVNVYWSLSPIADHSPWLISSLASTNDGVVVHHGIAGEISRYVLRCDRESRLADGSLQGSAGAVQ